MSIGSWLDALFHQHIGRDQLIRQGKGSSRCRGRRCVVHEGDMMECHSAEYTPSRFPAVHWLNPDMARRCMMRTAVSRVLGGDLDIDADSTTAAPIQDMAWWRTSCLICTPDKVLRATCQQDLACKDRGLRGVGCSTPVGHGMEYRISYQCQEARSVCCYWYFS